MKSLGVSVIIPVYNGDRFVPEAIDSVLAQTYPNYEIIVINDGSTDTTVQALQPYLDRIHYQEQANQGVASARNQGISLTQGEYIAFLDQDDRFLPDKLALQVACFEQYSHLAMVHSGWQTLNSQGGLITTVQPWQGLPTLDLAAWVQWKPVFLGAMLFRRQALLQMGKFDSTWRQTDDIDLVLRLAQLGGEAVWVKTATVGYRQHEQNMSRNSIEQVRELEAVLNQFFARSNLSRAVRQLESASRYQSLVWSACRFYCTEHRAEMALYLEKSLQHRASTWSEAVLDWATLFQQYGKEQGLSIRVEDLYQQPVWQTLIRRCIQQIMSEDS